MRLSKVDEREERKRGENQKTKSECEKSVMEMREEKVGDGSGGKNRKIAQSLVFIFIASFRDCCVIYLP